MRYGYFDDARKEYVITRPDTPAPWANYLGSPEYGALISGNAGGYSFVKSGASGRILRYIFDGQDRPGRYIYIRDNAAACTSGNPEKNHAGSPAEKEADSPAPGLAEDGGCDFWSASWQPVGKNLADYKTECRHGLSYTTIISEYSGIRSEVTYYVPKGCDHEVWHFTLTNLSGRPRDLTVTGYAEFTNNSHYEQDLVNLQYSRYISRTSFHDSLVLQAIHGNLDAMEAAGKNAHDSIEYRFFGLSGLPVHSWCGDKEAFLGLYHDYSNPIGVISGDLGNHPGYNEYPCGALSTRILLEGGASVSGSFLLGAKSLQDASQLAALYENAHRHADELAALRDEWEDRLSAFSVKTPCPEFDTMVNTWNAYNCFMTFIWSRAASFTYCGLRNGFGYRDTVQDIQGIIHLKPEMAAEKIRFMLTAQVDNGAGLPLVKFTHNPGHEDTPDDPSYVKETGHPAYRADDALWLFPTVWKYIAETGNLAFLDEMLPFANRGEGTVYEHLKRAVQFSLDHLGPHGLPAGLYADWNDCLRLGADGESTFVAFQFYYALRVLRAFAEKRGETADAEWLAREASRFQTLIASLAWNEDRFIRGFTEDGAVIGARTDSEANMWLNPQSWAVISGLASKECADVCMQQVFDRLNTEYGAILMDPPFHAEAFPGALAVIYNQGVKENAGIFSQSQGWLVLAEALLGHGDRAFAYWKENAPSLQNDRAEIRKLEPYCYGQFTEGKASPHFGRSHVHWLTGTASTMIVGVVEGILGMRPDMDGLQIDPAIPSEWDALTIEKDFRGHHLSIRIENPDHRESGVRSLVLNGETLPDHYIPAVQLKENNEILVTL